MKRPPLIYVAGPFSSATRAGVEENIRAAELEGIEIAKLGGFPVVLYTMRLWRSSKGASSEVELAYSFNMPVLENLSDVHRFLREWNQ